jgi:hypothetical protein
MDALPFLNCFHITMNVSDINPINSKMLHGNATKITHNHCSKFALLFQVNIRIFRTVLDELDDYQNPGLPVQVRLTAIQYDISSALKAKV